MSRPCPGISTRRSRGIERRAIRCSSGIGAHDHDRVGAEGALAAGALVRAEDEGRRGIREHQPVLRREHGVGARVEPLVRLLHAAAERQIARAAPQTATARTSDEEDDEADPEPAARAAFPGLRLRPGVARPRRRPAAGAGSAPSSTRGDRALWPALPDRPGTACPWTPQRPIIVATPGMSAPHVIAVDLGGTKLAAGLVDRDGAVVRRAVEPTELTSEEAVLAQIERLDRRAGRRRLRGARRRRPVHDRPARRARRHLREHPARRRRLSAAQLEGRFGVPVGIENDANAAARRGAPAGGRAGAPARGHAHARHRCRRRAHPRRQALSRLRRRRGRARPHHPRRSTARRAREPVPGAGHLEALASGAAADGLADRVAGEHPDGDLGRRGGGRPCRRPHLLVELASAGPGDALEVLEHVGFHWRRHRGSRQRLQPGARRRRRRVRGGRRPAVRDRAQGRGRAGASARPRGGRDRPGPARRRGRADRRRARRVRRARRRADERCRSSSARRRSGTSRTSRCGRSASSPRRISCSARTRGGRGSCSTATAFVRGCCRFHRHNEARRADGAPAAARGRRADRARQRRGAPGGERPGRRLVVAALERGLPVTVLPGPSAVETALVASGLVGERYTVPRLSSATRAPGSSASGESCAAGPGRPSPSSRRGGFPRASRAWRTAQPERPVAVCRELTKRFEEVVRGTAGRSPSGSGPLPRARSRSSSGRAGRRRWERPRGAGAGGRRRADCCRRSPPPRGRGRRPPDGGTPESAVPRLSLGGLTNAVCAGDVRHPLSPGLTTAVHTATVLPLT